MTEGSSKKEGFKKDTTLVGDGYVTLMIVVIFYICQLTKLYNFNTCGMLCINYTSMKLSISF